jgi:hypothetical protein
MISSLVADEPSPAALLLVRLLLGPETIGGGRKLLQGTVLVVVG